MLHSGRCVCVWHSPPTCWVCGIPVQSWVWGGSRSPRALSVIFPCFVCITEQTHDSHGTHDTPTLPNPRGLSTVPATVCSTAAMGLTLSCTTTSSRVAPGGEQGVRVEQQREAAEPLPVPQNVLQIANCQLLTAQRCESGEEPRRPILDRFRLNGLQRTPIIPCIQQSTIDIYLAGESWFSPFFPKNVILFYSFILHSRCHFCVQAVCSNPKTSTCAVFTCQVTTRSRNTACDAWAEGERRIQASF